MHFEEEDLTSMRNHFLIFTRANLGTHAGSQNHLYDEKFDTAISGAGSRMPAA